MKSESLPPRRRRRIPKPGCFFRGLLILGDVFAGLGGLTTLGGLWGFGSTFIKAAPDLLSAPQYLDQPFTLFVLTLIATYFGAFAGLGCLGLLVMGLGFFLIFISTEPIKNHPIDKPTPTA